MAPLFNEVTWDGSARRTGASHKSAQRQELLGRAKLGQGSAGPQGSHTDSHPSKGKTEIRGRKSAGFVMAGQRLQVPRKLLVLTELTMGTAISAAGMWRNGLPPHAIHKPVTPPGASVHQASMSPLPPAPCRGMGRGCGQPARGCCHHLCVRPASLRQGPAPGRDRQGWGNWGN